MTDIAFILASHGYFAQEALKSAEMIVGEQSENKVRALSMTLGIDLNQFKEKIQKVVDEFGVERNILILTDLMGGTPNNASVYSLISNNNVQVISGLNLPVLIEAFTNEHMDLNELKEHLIEVGKSSFIDMEKYINKMEECKMAIDFVRIDDRLVHGQVATTWIKKYEIEQVIVINDLLANDPVQKSVLEMTAPQGIRILLFGVDKFTEVYKNNPIKRKTMLIYTNPEDVYRNLKAGVKIPYLNVGGMKHVLNKEKLTKAVAVDEKDKMDFKEIMNLGVNVEIQMIPADKVTNMKEFIK